ncbi:gamma-glutamyl-gamma-aminobutyrate hydrolase family protein [Nocardia gipuzkoensis]
MCLADPRETREGLDIRWRSFLRTCGITMLPLPNDIEMAVHLMEKVEPAGLLLTGGEDLTALGGTAIGREQTESALIDWALARRLRVHGVCRGMQLLLHRTGVDLEVVDGHVATRHRLDGSGRTVNSFHRYGARQVNDVWRVTQRSGDVVEAVEHHDAPISATMWHPEREHLADPADVREFQKRFGVLN